MVQEKDYLTGLHSRQGLYHFCATIEYNTLISFMFLDIDNFKSVNDIYGHNTGDELLKRMAVLLEENVPNGYIVRLGGDEFCIVFVPASKREQLEQIATLLIKSMNTKIIEHLTTNISISIGILTGERYQNNLDVILNKSDHAMYHAKSKGKGCFVFFNEIEELISF